MSPSVTSNQTGELVGTPQLEPNLDCEILSPAVPPSGAVAYFVSPNKNIEQLSLSVSWIGKRQPPFPDTAFNPAGLSPPLSTTSDASHDVPLTTQVELELISLFFSKVSLPIPVFCAAKFYLDYEAGNTPRYLLDAMFSLSARFSNAPEILTSANGNIYRLGKYFAQKAYRVLDVVNRDVFSRIELKAAYLLTYHDLTYLPSREGAQQCAKLARMAYVCRLHQIDNMPTFSSTVATNDDSNSGQMKAIEREEGRCLWWAIFSLDTFSSLISFIPSNIEDSSIATCLPSSIITDVTVTDLPLQKGVYLDDDENFWSTVRMQVLTGVGIQSLLLYVVRLAREITIARRWYYENPRCNLASKLEFIRKTWEALLTNVPSWFLDPVRHELDTSTSQHRKRLEALNMISILGAMSSFPPLELNLRLPLGSQSSQGIVDPENAWNVCVSHAMTMSNSYQSWTQEHFLTVDPIMMPMTWMATCILIIETMNTSAVNSTERLATLNAVDILMSSLHNSKSWSLITVLMRSVVELRGQSWRKLDLSAIHQLLLTLSAPQNQDREEEWRSPGALEPAIGYSGVANEEELNGMMSAEPMSLELMLPPVSNLEPMIDWLNEEQGNGLWQDFDFTLGEASN